MRILLVSALLLATASCAWPPPAETAMPAAQPAGPPPPVALIAPAPPPPTVLAAPVPQPAVVAIPPPPPPMVAPVVYLPNPLAWLFTPIFPAPAGRLTLSNFSFDTAHVQAVITPYPDCAVHEGTATSDFVLPLNGTHIVVAAPGSDVCWRREVGPAQGTPAATPGWTEWNRVFLSSAHSVDSRL